MCNALQEEKYEQSRVLSKNHTFIGKIQCHFVCISKPLLLMCIILSNFHGLFHLYAYINQWIIWLMFQVEPYQWDGKFSQSAETILTQHLVQCGLSKVAVTLAEWVEFASVHVDHPLSFIIFSLLLQKLVKPLQKGFITEEEVGEQTLKSHLILNSLTLSMAVMPCSILLKL